MRSPLAARLSRALVACYPPRWKQRYREEMLDVLDQHQASSRTVLSLAGGALTAHLDPSYRMGRPVIKNKAVRALLIAAAGCMAVIALVYGVFTYTDVNQLIGDLVWHPGHAEGDVALVFTPDQRLLATLEGGEPDTAVVTLMSVGPAGLRQLSSFEGGVTVAIAPDGHLVATSGYGGEAALWNVARPRHPALLAILRPGSSNALWGEAFSPDSKLLAAAYGGTTALWDVARPAEPRLLTVLAAHVGPVTHADIAFSPDGHLLALANGNGQVTIWDVTRPARATPVATITVRDDYFQALAFSPQGDLLAGVTTAGTVLVYRLDDPGRPALTGQPLRTRGAGPVPGRGAGPGRAGGELPRLHGCLVRAGLRSRRARPDRSARQDLSRQLLQGHGVRLAGDRVRQPDRRHLRCPRYLGRAARAGPGRPHHRRRLGVRPHRGRPVGADSRRRVAAVHPSVTHP
jgi:WD domain, G-beta repeat